MRLFIEFSNIMKEISLPLKLKPEKILFALWEFKFEDDGVTSPQVSQQMVQQMKL